MCKNLWQLVLFLILSLAVFFVNPADVIHAETRLQPDTIISGSVEITTDGETWTAFNQDGALKAGDSIRTGEGSAVSLKAEDGSTLYLEEQTQLTIAELTFSAIDRARIFRFYLERGILTVKVGNVESKASAFDVTTRSVLVRLHQQSAGDMETRARIIANPLTTSQLNATLLASASDTRGLLIAKLLPPIGSTGSTGASEDPFASKVQPLSGKFDVEQLNNEKTLVEITVGSGVTFTMTLPGQTITLTIDRGNISLTSDQPLPANMVFETSGGNNSVILTNPNQDPSMNPEFMVGDHTCTMGENSSVGLAVAPESADREFSITLPGVLSFNFNFTSDPTVGELTITALQGTIKLDGEELPLNTPVNPGNGDEVLPTDISGPSTGAGAGGGDPAPTPGPTPTETEGSPIQP